MWYLIPLILALVIVFLLFLKIRVCLSYEDEFVVKVKVLFLNFSIIPKKEKKIKPKNYSLKKLQKRQDKLKKKNQKKEQKKQKHNTNIHTKKCKLKNTWPDIQAT